MNGRAASRRSLGASTTYFRHCPESETDAFAGGPDAGWELAAWLGTTTARQALAIALTGMVRNSEVSRARAEEIATMVMRTNAGRLYNLPLK